MINTSPYPDVTPLPESSVWDFVWSNPNKLPDTAPAVIDGLTGRVISRGELRTTAQKLAYGLRHTLKVAPGDVVVTFSPNSAHYHLMVLAIQCAGSVVSGANAAYSPTELAHQLENSAAKVILAAPSTLDVALQAAKAAGWTAQQQRERIVVAALRDEAGAAGKGRLTLSDLIGDELLAPHPIRHPKSTIAYLGYSSGTSGKAKGVQTSHFNMTSVLSILHPLSITQNDVQLAVLPLSHIYGLTKILHWPVLVGTPVVVLPRFDLVPFCRAVQTHKVSVVMLVPPIALSLARDPEVSKWDLSSLRLVISGAAPMGKDLEDETAARLKCEVGQAYGLTETSPTTHFSPTPRSGSIGTLLPNIKSRICDVSTGEDLGTGKEGEMLLSGPTVMLGYHNNPQSTAETLVKDKDGKVWLRTGDIAYVDPDGYHFVTDRIKELIKYKGHQVAPAELESTLIFCPFVSDAAVIGINDPSQATELPRGYVVLSAAGRKEPPGEVAASIRKWVDERVANHKKLRGGVRVIDAIPKSPSGKILRRVLSEQAKAEAAKDAAEGGGASAARAKL